MQDLTVKELADDIREEFLDMGIELSQRDVRIIVAEYFKNVEKIINRCCKDGSGTFSIWCADINTIYVPLNVKELCAEFAMGENSKEIDYHYNVMKKSFIRPSIGKYLK